MRFIIFAIIVIVIMTFFLASEDQKDPYSEGIHLDYHIQCKNGFKYKVSRYGTIPLKNADGTDMKCY
jgi:hypothetical protein